MRRHLALPRHLLALASAALVLGGCGSTPASNPATTSARAGGAPAGAAASSGAPPAIFAQIAGTWDWAGRPGTCRDNPHTLSFTPDGRYMLLTFAHPIDSTTGKREVRYELRGHTERSVRGFITDETRRTEGGELVVWDLVLFSPTSYRWHRTDWPETGFTPEVIRCTTSI